MRCLLLLIIFVVLAKVTTAEPVRKLIVWGVTLGPNDKGQTDVVREFERRHPGLKVETLMMGSGGMNPQKLMTAIAGGQPPDVVYQDRFTLADWASRGAFMPLDDLIVRSPDFKVSDYYSSVWAEACFEGKVYGVPWMADTRILTWNRAVFREKAVELRSAGLDPGRAPRTWSELLAYSKVLTEKNPDGTLRRAGFIPNFGNAWFTMYAALNSAQLMSPDGRTCTLDCPEAIEALEFVRSCYEVLGGAENSDRFATTFRGEENDAFFTGQVAMKIDGDWALAGIARYAPKLDFGAVPPPVPDDRFAKHGRFASIKHTWTTWAGGFAWSIPRGAQRVEDAWEFIKFVNSFEGRMMEVRHQDDLNRARGQMTFPRITAHKPTNLASLRDFLPKNANLAAAVKLHSELLDMAVTRPVSFAGKVLWDESNRATDAVLHGELSSQEALALARQAVQRVLDDREVTNSRPIADLVTPTVIGTLGVVVALILIATRARGAFKGRRARQEAWAGHLFAAPWTIGFVILSLGPLVSSAVVSFTQWNILQSPRWVGAKNYQDLFGPDSATLGKAFYNVFYLAGIGLPLGLVTGLSIALLLHSLNRSKGFFQSLVYMPSIVPGVATVVMWLWILHPDPKIGLANSLWSATVGDWFHLPSPGWIAAEDWAKPTLVLMGLGGAGSGIVIWLAGLRGVPKELYEAAALDGAGPWRQFSIVTLPHLAPLLFFNSVTGFIGVLQTFDAVFISSGGNSAGPNDSLLVPVFHLFQNAFNYFRMGYASALAWIIFAVVMVVTAIQFLVARRYVTEESTL